MSASSPMSAKQEEAELLRRLSKQLDKRTPTDVISDDGVLKVTTRPKAFASYSTSVLTASAAAKAVAKACVAVNISTAQTDAYNVFDELFEECRLKYTKLTKQMVLAKIEAQTPLTEPTDETEDDDGAKLRKSLEIVDAEMEKYNERVDSMKAARASLENTDESGNAKKKKRARTTSSSTPKKKRKYKKCDSDEQKLIRAIVDKYAQIRLTKHYTSKAEWSEIVEETKKEMGMEDWSLAHDLLKKRVTWFYMKHPLNKQAVRLNHYTKEDKEVVNKIYVKYCEAKKAANNELLPDGHVEKLVKEELAQSSETPDEHGTSRIAVYKCRVQARFIKEHPELFSGVKMDEDQTKWTKAQRDRFKLLGDEVSKRKIEMKIPSTNKALEKGLIDDLVESTKMEWDMMQFPLKATTPTRQKKSPRREKKKTGEKKKKSKVMATAIAINLHDTSIDPDMVKVINDRLANGFSVTRQQGIEIAQSILVVRNITNFPKLNQTWWKAFLARNRGMIDREGSESTPGFRDDSIDREMLVKVNELLTSGTAVTRHKGLGLARSICEEKGMSSVGALLDASWWKGFLARNRDKL